MEEKEDNIHIYRDKQFLSMKNIKTIGIQQKHVCVQPQTQTNTNRCTHLHKIKRQYHPKILAAYLRKFFANKTDTENWL